MKNKKSLFLLFAFMLVWGMGVAQVTYTLGDIGYYTQFASGGAIFANSGTAELGMWANTGSKQIVAWRNLKTAGDNTGSTRNLQVGDVFTISVYASAAYGQMGFSLNSTAATTSWADRNNNSRLYIQVNGATGSWYVTHNGGNTTLNYNVSTTGHTYTFKVFITSISTCDVEFYVDNGFTNRLMNLFLKGTDAANIDGFSLYLNDDWNGSTNSNIYWKQTTQHQALGTVNLGYNLATGNYNPGLVQDGFESNSTTTGKTNNIFVGGDAGSMVIFDQPNTYSGTTTVNTNARLELENTAALGSTTGLTVQNNATLSLYFASGTNTYNTYAITLNGGGVSGANGALRSTGGTNTWPGGITLASGSRINADETGAAGSLTLSGAITLAANTLTVGGTTSGVTLSGKISGTGGLSKDGDNSLTLSNTTNDYSGTNTLSAGTLSIANSSVLGAGGITLGNGPTTCTLDITATTAISQAISITDASTAGVINIASGQTFTLSGGLANTGSTNTTKYGKSGGGTFIVSGASTYAGQIQIGEGGVIVQNSSGLGANTSTSARGIDLGLNVGDVSIGNNVVLQATNGITVPQSIYVAPNTSSATRTISLNGTGTATFNNEVYLHGNLIASGGSGTVTMSGALINTGGLIASGGTVILSGANTYSGATAVSAGTLELQSSLASSAVTVNSGAILKINGSAVTISSLTIDAGGIVQILPGKSLTVSGTLTNNAGNTGLVIQSDANGTGSLIHSSSVSGTVQRYISAYSSNSNGWHLLACPVTSFTVTGSSFQPVSGQDDLYYYNESQNRWMNWGTANFDFGTDQGYLCAYKTSAIKSFTGTLNYADKTISNVSYTAAQGGGWHLIPNPFSSAITWNSSISAPGYASTASAKILNGGTSYSDISDGQPVPAMNSFFMQVNSATNSITIPAASRAHNSQGWYKSSEGELLMLTVQSNENTTYQENIIRFNSNATEGFDPLYDSQFLPGMQGTPRMYSFLADNTELSLNTFPPLSGSRVVPLGFIKGTSSAYSLNLSKMENIADNVSIILEDTKENKTQDLKQNPSYLFNSSEGDNVKRFLLHLNDPNGVNEQKKNNNLSIYSDGHTIYISSLNNSWVKGKLFVYNLMGQQLMQQELGSGALTKVNLNCSTGYYLVKVVTSDNAYSGKVFLQ